LFWDWKLNAEEGIKSYLYVVAVWTKDLRPVEALKQVSDFRRVAGKLILLEEFENGEFFLLVCNRHKIRMLNVGLLSDSVKVFVEFLQ